MKGTWIPSDFAYFLRLYFELLKMPYPTDRSAVRTFTDNVVDLHSMISSMRSAAVALQSVLLQNAPDECPAVQPSRTTAFQLSHRRSIPVRLFDPAQPTVAAHVVDNTFEDDGQRLEELRHSALHVRHGVLYCDTMQYVVAPGSLY